MTRPEGGYGRDWWPTLNRLQPVEVARVCAAVEQFTRDPDHNSLNMHPLNGAGRTLHTFRATQRAHVTRQYLRDEITAVVKGRGLTTLEDYLAVERTRQQPARCRAAIVDEAQDITLVGLQLV